MFESTVSYKVSEAVECSQGEVKGEPSDKGKDTVKGPRGPAATAEYRRWHYFVPFKIRFEIFLSETCDILLVVMLEIQFRFLSSSPCNYIRLRKKNQMASVV